MILCADYLHITSIVCMVAVIQDGSSPIALAARNGQVEVVELLENSYNQPNSANLV